MYYNPLFGDKALRQGAQQLAEVRGSSCRGGGAEVADPALLPTRSIPGLLLTEQGAQSRWEELLPDYTGTLPSPPYPEH